MAPRDYRHRAAQIWAAAANGAHDDALQKYLRHTHYHFERVALARCAVAAEP